jgi:hypothetical protein
MSTETKEKKKNQKEKEKNSPPPPSFNKQEIKNKIKKINPLKFSKRKIDPEADPTTTTASLETFRSMSRDKSCSQSRPSHNDNTKKRYGYGRDNFGRALNDEKVEQISHQSKNFNKYDLLVSKITHEVVQSPEYFDAFCAFIKKENSSLRVIEIAIRKTIEAMKQRQVEVDK